MATLYDHKPQFQAILRPLANRLAALGATANAVTVAATGLSAIFGALVMTFPTNAILLGGLPIVLLLRMALNAIDGMLAREHGQASLTGAKLNEVGDVVSDLCLYLPLAAVFHPGWPVVLAASAGIVAEFAGVMALAHGGRRRYDGPLGKSDRALLFAALAVAHACVGLSTVTVTTAFLLATAASAATVCNRLFREPSHA
jgi:CDP-diacylglycerol---glycerol-3-phosphate 3-phosphatidyltransferase